MSDAVKLPSPNKRSSLKNKFDISEQTIEVLWQMIPNLWNNTLTPWQSQKQFFLSIQKEYFCLI